MAFRIRVVQGIEGLDAIATGRPAGLYRNDYEIRLWLPTNSFPQHPEFTSYLKFKHYTQRPIRADVPEADHRPVK